MSITLRFDTTPPLLVGFTDPSPRLADYVEAEYGRLAVASSDSDFEFRFVDHIPESTSWENVGEHVRFQEQGLLLLDGTAKAQISLDGRGPVEATVENGVSVDFLRFQLINPVVTALAVRHQAVAIHGSATALGDTGLLLTGLPGSGKTETTLRLVQSGHAFLGDDRLLLTLDGRLVPLQGRIGFKAHTLSSDLDLRKTSTPRSYRAARAGARILRRGDRALKALPANLARQMGVLLGRAAADIEGHPYLIDVARAVPGAQLINSARLRVICLLTTGEPATIVPATDDEVKQWLWAVRHDDAKLFSVIDPCGISDPELKGLADDIRQRQREILYTAIKDVQAVRIRVPPKNGGRWAAAEIRKVLDSLSDDGAEEGTV